MIRQWLIYARGALPEEIRGSLLSQAFGMHNHWLLMLGYQQCAKHGILKELLPQRP